jgi:hypothetical protein
MSQAGLSYDQAPPFGLPLRFFLTAPLFIVLAAAAGIPSAGAWTASRLSPEAVALTHLITLGFLGQVMMGALLQMLPVVIGSPVPWPRLTGGLGHLGLTAGSLLLAGGLGWGEPSLMRAGMAALAGGWLPFLAATAISLVRARPASKATLYPMRQAWFALLITLALGFWLGGALSGLWPPEGLVELMGLHAAWGLLGWVLILIMGVAYQVVPMLQITPPYPAPVVAWLTWTLLAGLLLLSLAVVLLETPTKALQALIWLPVMGAMAVFATVTLRLQHRRRRKLADATLGFWRLGMASLLLLSLLPLVTLLEDRGESMETAAGLLFLLGFAASVVNGMLYKIVPFLAWFHLQSQTRAKAGTIPNMKEFIPEGASRLHLRLHLTAVGLLLPAPWLPPAYSVAGLVVLALSGLILWRNLLGCTDSFKRYGGRLA